MAWLKGFPIWPRQHRIGMAKDVTGLWRDARARRESFGRLTGAADRRVLALWVIRWQPYYDVGEYNEREQNPESSR